MFQFKLSSQYAVFLHEQGVYGGKVRFGAKHCCGSSRKYFKIILEKVSFWCPFSFYFSFFL
jgi:hypothetical protein